MLPFPLVFRWRIFEYIHADGKEWRGERLKMRLTVDEMGFLRWALVERLS